MHTVRKLIFPVVLLVIGLVAVINGFATYQNGAFMLGAFALLLAGGLSLIFALTTFSKTLRTVLSLVLLLLVVGLAYADYMSIKVPIEFQNEKVRRYEFVIQHLKDIRKAQLAYKATYQRYAGSADTLVDFIKNDSLMQVAQTPLPGYNPDSMSRAEAIKEGLILSDTTKVPVIDSLFFSRAEVEQRHHPFNADSLFVVPFTGGKGKFEMEAGMVSRSGAEVPVFEAKDGMPFDKRDVKRVGSLTDPKTNGNWE